MVFSKEEIIPKKHITSNAQIPKRQGTSKAQIPKKQNTYKSKTPKKQRTFKKVPERLKSKQKYLKNKQKEIEAAAVKTFFSKDTIEKIRFLHYKINQSRHLKYQKVTTASLNHQVSSVSALTYLPLP